MPVSSSPERRHRARIAAHTSWAQTNDRTARTAPARAALESRFDDQVDPARVLTAEERGKRSANARKAYYLALALKSAQARAARRRGIDRLGGAGT